LTEADEREAGHAFKGMRAALRLQEFRNEDVEVLHDDENGAWGPASA